MSYFEAVNKESLRNAYQRFVEEGMVEARKHSDGKAGVPVRLADEWLCQRMQLDC